VDSEKHTTTNITKKGNNSLLIIGRALSSTLTSDVSLYLQQRQELHQSIKETEERVYKDSTKQMESVETKLDH
jgi:hypothetical protein